MVRIMASNDLLSISCLTTGEWKDFVDQVTHKERFLPLSLDDHGTWCESFGSESSLIVRNNFGNDHQIKQTQKMIHKRLK